MGKQSKRKAKSSKPKVMWSKGDETVFEHVVNDKVQLKFGTVVGESKKNYRMIVVSTTTTMGQPLLLTLPASDMSIAATHIYSSIESYSNPEICALVVAKTPRELSTGFRQAQYLILYLDIQ